MRKQRTWTLLAAGPAATLDAFADEIRNGITRLRSRLAPPPTVTIRPGTTSPWLTVQFSENDRSTDLDDAGHTLAERLTTRWPELRLTLLGLSTTDNGAPLLLHVGCTNGRPNDAHTHYDALHTVTIITDTDGALRAVVTPDPTGTSFTIENGDARPSAVAVTQALGEMLRRQASAYALLTRIGGGYRLAAPNLDEARLRRWGTDTTYPVFELLPEAGLDEILRHPEVLDDWNSQGSLPLPMLRYYDPDRLPELTHHSNGPAGDTALTVALQLVYRARHVDARQSTRDIVAATGHPRAALQLLDQLNRTGHATKAQAGRLPRHSHRRTPRQPRAAR